MFHKGRKKINKIVSKEAPQDSPAQVITKTTHDSNNIMQIMSQEHYIDKNSKVTGFYH